MNVKDITVIQDDKSRAAAERVCIETGKCFIMEREGIKTGQDFVDIVKICEEKWL